MLVDCGKSLEPKLLVKVCNAVLYIITNVPAREANGTDRPLGVQEVAPGAMNKIVCFELKYWLDVIII
jgi:hypothetical protein